MKTDMAVTPGAQTVWLTVWFGDIATIGVAVLATIIKP